MWIDQTSCACRLSCGVGVIGWDGVLGMSERVLVTGGTGFLGGYVTRALVAEGATVTVLARRRDAELARLPVEIWEADLGDGERLQEACRGQDMIQHVGGISGVGGTWQEFYQTNTVATEALLAGARRYGVKKFIYTSSPSVTFDGQDQCGVDERAPYPHRWLCHYSRSKMLAEQAVLAAHDPRGLLTCALRPHLIWGPGDRHLIPRLLDRARRGLLRRVGDGKNWIDITYVENAAQAQLQVARKLVPDSGIGGRAYFLSQGEPVNCWEWIDRVLALANLPRVQRSISFPAAWYLGWGLESLYRLAGLRGEPRMTRFVAAQLAKSHYFDISAARRDWGYEVTVSTDEGLRRLANWLGKG